MKVLISKSVLAASKLNTTQTPQPSVARGQLDSQMSDGERCGRCGRTAAVFRFRAESSRSADELSFEAEKVVRTFFLRFLALRPGIGMQRRTSDANRSEPLPLSALRRDFACAKHSRDPTIQRWNFDALAGLLFLALLVLPGCATSSQARTGRAEALAVAPKALDVSDSSTNSAPKPARFKKWNPVWWFRNVDDTTPPDWYRPNDPNRHARFQWRNPAHNFTFYVIGIADKEFVRTGKHPKDVFNPSGGWNWAVSRYKWLRLPFISYRGNVAKFYFGWRERGNFGIKLTFSKPEEPKESAAASVSQ